jgi:multiple sugar transport system substrate-binding protein
MTGCGNGSSGSGSTGGAGSASGDSPKPAKQITLKIGLPGSYDVTSKDILDNFTKSHPNIKLDVEEMPWGDFSQKITTEIAGGTAPDLWFQENAVILGYGKRGVAEDLTPYITKDINKDDYVSTLFAGKDPNGKIWGIPHGINPIALAYNKKVFTDAGVPFPTNDWTYTDLINTAKKLTKDTNGDGTPDIWGFMNSGTITTGWYPWTRAAGGQVLDDTRTKAMFNSPKSVEGLKMWTDMQKNGLSPDGPTIKAMGNDWGSPAQGKAAMMFMQYSQAPLANKQVPDGDYDTVMIPKSLDGVRRVTSVPNSWMIFSRAKKENKDAAWEFLKYYMSDEAQSIVAKSGSELPIKKTALDEVEKLTSTKPANKKAYTQGIAEAGTLTDESAAWREWTAAVRPIMSDMFNLKVSVDDGVKQLMDAVQPILDSNK